MKKPWMILAIMAIFSLLLASCADSIITVPSSTETTNAIPTDTPQPYIDLSYLADADPALVDNSELPVTPIDQLHVTGTAPSVNIVDYRLTVDGFVDKPLTLTYDNIVSYPSVTKVVLLICPITFVDNAEWTGVLVSTLLTEAGIKSGATEVAFQSLDGYKVTVPLEDVQQEGVFLANTVNGEVLPLEHGYPLRLVIEGEYGGKWVKWVTHIEVM
jgi:DMSO/TMAO reductase YedYZ molybdopterin-dependent catalytic subunit